MSRKKIVIAAGDMVTPYGWGLEACWEGILSKRCAIQPVRHFDTSSFHAYEAGLVEGLAGSETSRVMAMLRPLFERAGGVIPKDSLCLLATTIGEIEFLEKSVLEEKNSAGESCPSRLLSKIEKMAGLPKPGMVISAACSSSIVAIAEGAAMIADGEQESVLIVACDSVSEFLYSGFLSLLALDPGKARPFDQNREGLSLGEAAGYLLLMSEERALLERRTILGEVVGTGLSNDANHMTGPSRDGSGLAIAITQCLEQACVEKKDVANISAHGTGTLYNDSMEMKAFKTVFGDCPVPAYSIKGGIGHTMAAAGLIEALIALKSLEEQRIPSTIGMSQVDDEALGWISGEVQAVPGDYALSTNSGFGGINAALLLKRWPR